MEANCATCPIKRTCEVRDLVEAGLGVCDEQENRPELLVNYKLAQIKED